MSTPCTLWWSPEAHWARWRVAAVRRKTPGGAFQEVFLSPVDMCTAAARSAQTAAAEGAATLGLRKTNGS